jgi:hypothetical protein
MNSCLAVPGDEQMGIIARNRFNFLRSFHVSIFESENATSMHQIPRAEASNAEVRGQDLLLSATTAKVSYLLAATISSPSSIQEPAWKEMLHRFLKLFIIDKRCDDACLASIGR